MNKIMLLLLGMFALSFTSGLECWSVAKENTNIELIQKCPSCTFVNITSISYPNGTVFLNSAMTKTGPNFNFTLPDSSQRGRISYGVIGDKNGADPAVEETLCIEITGTGFQLETSHGILLLGLLALLICIFLLTMFGYFKIPDHIRDDGGFVLNVSKLSHLKPVMLGLAWIMLTAIVFMASNIASGYLFTGLFFNFLFALWQLMALSNLVILPLCVIFMIQRIVMSKEMMGMIERGVQFK